MRYLKLYNNSKVSIYNNDNKTSVSLFCLSFLSRLLNINIQELEKENPLD